MLCFRHNIQRGVVCDKTQLTHIRCIYSRCITQRVWSINRSYDTVVCTVTYLFDTVVPPTTAVHGTTRPLTSNVEGNVSVGVHEVILVRIFLIVYNQSVDSKVLQGRRNVRTNLVGHSVFALRIFWD